MSAFQIVCVRTEREGEEQLQKAHISMLEVVMQTVMLLGQSESRNLGPETEASIFTRTTSVGLSDSSPPLFDAWSSRAAVVLVISSICNRVHQPGGILL